VVALGVLGQTDVDVLVGFLYVLDDVEALQAPVGRLLAENIL
jgi:hypothetical protein